MERTTAHPVICFGEVLWDVLPSGAVPGGAPMNVAYHLEKMGKSPALITRVGTDERGEALESIFAAHGVCTDYFQRDASHQTGIVYAHPNEHNEVVYDIVKPVAYDFIEWKEGYDALVSSAGYFVFGSLAARNDVSKKTLFQLIECAKTRVLDINLRAPHYDRRIVEELLQKTDFLKLNGAELELITGWFSGNKTNTDRMQLLADRFNIQTIVVTMGGEGAQLYYQGNTYSHQGFSVQVKDTVGSGDAFLAGLLSNLMDGASPADALAFANALGAFIATRTGACPAYDTGEVRSLLQQASAKHI